MAWKLNNLLVLLAILSCSFTRAGDPLELDRSAWEEKSKELVYDDLKDWKMKERSSSSSFRTPNTSPAMSLIVPIIAMVLLVLVLIFILSRSSVNKLSTSNRPNVQIGDIDQIPEEEELAAILAKKEEEADFRQALRIRYLRILKWLTDNGDIVWEKHKTNSQYKTEMRPHPDHLPFVKATYIFDNVWYGEIELDRASYDTLRPSLDQLLQRWQANG